MKHESIFMFRVYDKVSKVNHIYKSTAFLIVALFLTIYT